MATKLYYAIDYRRMHTGIHGLLIFEDKVTADRAMTKIRKLLQKVDALDRDKEASEEERHSLQFEYDFTLKEVFEMAVDCLDEINYNNIVWVVKYNKNLKEYKYKLNERTVRVINTSVDLYV